MEHLRPSPTERNGYYSFREFNDAANVAEVAAIGFEFVGHRGQFTWHEGVPGKALANHYVRAFKKIDEATEMIMSMDHRGLCIVVGPPVGYQWDADQNAHELLQNEQYREIDAESVPESSRRAFERYYLETLRAAREYFSSRCG